MLYHQFSFCFVSTEFTLRIFHPSWGNFFPFSYSTECVICIYCLTVIVYFFSIQNVSIIHDKTASLSQDAARSKYTSEYFEDVQRNVIVIQSDSQEITNACRTNYSVQASNALGTAQIAKTEADKADIAAQNVHARVDRVVRDAARLREVNVTRLNELKVEIETVRLNFTGMNIKGIIRDLRKAKQEQEQFLSEQKAKLLEKSEQVAELKLLFASLTSVTCDKPTGMLV